MLGATSGFDVSWYLTSPNYIKKMSLSSAVQKRADERRLKEKSMMEKSAQVAIAMQKRAEAKKKELAELEQRKLQEENLRIFRENERLRILKESKTKPYFELNKFNRKVIPNDKPVYYGDMIAKSTAWLPHGKGQFLLNDAVKMDGEYKDGQFIRGIIHFENGISWEGLVHNDKMHGVGVITQHTLVVVEPPDSDLDDDNDDHTAVTAATSSSELRIVTSVDDVKREAIAHNNKIICFQDELVVGKQVEFHEPVFNVYTSRASSRNPVAVIISRGRDWRCVCRFSEEVEPRERVIDFATIPQFRLLQHMPTIYNMSTFGINADPNRVYDYRPQEAPLTTGEFSESNHELSTHRQITQRAEMLNLIAVDNSDSVSWCSESVGSVHDQSVGDMRKINSHLSLKSLKSNVSFSTMHTGTTQYSGTNTNFTHTTTASLARANNPKYYNTRLLPEFPSRLANSARRNMFESRAVGIGAAQEEEEIEKLAEVKKKQWAALIADKRAAQEAQRQREIEEQQQSALQSSLVAQKKLKESKQREDEEYAEATRQAVDDELSRISGATR